jgi:hypothetical protein
MKKISVVVGLVLALIVELALAKTATESVLAKVALAKGCDCIWPYLNMDKLLAAHLGGRRPVRLPL